MDHRFIWLLFFVLCLSVHSKTFPETTIQPIELTTSLLQNVSTKNDDQIIDKVPGEDEDENDVDFDWKDDDQDETISYDIFQMIFHLQALQTKLHGHKKNNDPVDKLVMGRQYDEFKRTLHSFAMIGLKILPELSQNCKFSLKQFVDALTNGQWWSVQMIDSVGILPNAGLTRGPLINFGSYDQCLSIMDQTTKIRGQYCMMESRLKMKPNQTDWLYWLISKGEFDGNEPLKVLSNKIIRRKFRFMPALRFYQGLCVPDQCNQDDVQNVFDTIFDESFLKVNVSRCQLEEQNSSNQWLSITFFVICLLPSTVYFVLHCLWQKSKFITILSGKDAHEAVAVHKVNSVDGIRVLTLMLVVHFHTYLLTFSNSMLDLITKFETIVHMSPVEWLTTGWVLFETLILLAAFYESYTMNIALNKENNKMPLAKLRLFIGRFLSGLLIRWSGMALILMTTIMILPSISHGPQSVYVIDEQVRHCTEHWWQTLMLFTNDQNVQCLPHSWILSVEMQFYLFIFPLALLLTETFQPNIKKLMANCLVLLVISIVPFIFYYNYYNHHLKLLVDGTVQSTERFLLDYLSWNQNPWLHLSPYVIGYSLGYLLSGTPIQIKQSLSWVLWFLLGITSILFNLAIYFSENLGGKWYTIILLSIYRPICSLFIGALILLTKRSLSCSQQSHFNPVTWLLTKPTFFKFMDNGLCYLCYLWHYLIIVHRDSRRRRPLFYSDWTIIEEFIVNLIMSISLSCLTRMIIVKPLRASIDCFLWLVYSKRSENHPKTQCSTFNKLEPRNFVAKSFISQSTNSSCQDHHSRMDENDHFDENIEIGCRLLNEIPFNNPTIQNLSNK